MFKSEMITPISHEEIQQKGVEEPKQNSWNDIPNEEFFKKVKAEVKVKFTSGEIIGFTPFKQCCSIPPQYHLKNYTAGKKINFRFVYDFISDIEINGVESNNIEYLEEAKIKAKHMKLNLDL